MKEGNRFTMDVFLTGKDLQSRGKSTAHEETYSE
jgi:hypothetical protein